MKMKNVLFLLTPLIVLALVASSPAKVELDVLKTYKMEQTPLDMAVSFNGQVVYVLTDEGIIYIYSTGGELRDKISVGKSIDGIKAAPREGMLFISSRKNKTVQLITLDSVRNINVSGSPFKGPAKAPVVIAVFSDFQ